MGRFKSPYFVKWVEEILYEEGPMTAGDLMLRLKARIPKSGDSGRTRKSVPRGVRNLPAYKSLTNLLSKSPQFTPVGQIQVPSKLNPNHRYPVILYGLVKGFREEE